MITAEDVVLPVTPLAAYFSSSALVASFSLFPGFDFKKFFFSERTREELSKLGSLVG